MRQTSFAAAAIRPRAVTLFQMMAPPATTPASQAREIAIDMTDAGIIDRAEAMTLGGFLGDRDWNRTARQYRAWRKRRAL